MSIPEDRKYTSSHEWVKLEDDGNITDGISYHAQETLGDIVFLELPEPGRMVNADEECAIVESVKAAADIYAPVAGEIVARNDALLDTPQSVNQDSYAAWLFKLKPTNLDELNTLLDASAYAATAAASA